jgi:hypothetical protein
MLYFKLKIVKARFLFGLRQEIAAALEYPDVSSFHTKAFRDW